ncbi:hypothetical protein FRC19_005779 [Serendipita sp. 401]|nr:hypothetical protein FRC19_005779 [Serendipita sp. 401]KAG9043815.1 hypothetical protein FS842_001706 [Serendipita sp. 407]
MMPPAVPKTSINLTNPYFAAAVHAIFLQFQSGVFGRDEARNQLRTLYGDTSDFESETERDGQVQFWFKLLDDVATVFPLHDRALDDEEAAQERRTPVSGTGLETMASLLSIQPRIKETVELSRTPSPFAPQNQTTRNVDLKGEQHTALTLALVTQYTRNLAYSRGFLTSHVGVPKIPSFIWDLVLENKYVDLNQVLRYAVDDETAVEVKTQYQWCRCWIVYSRAVMLAFPHRTCELFRYSTWISRLFSGMQEELHPSIVRMDAVFRAQVDQARFDDGNLAVRHLFTTVFQSDAASLESFLDSLQIQSSESAAAAFDSDQMTRND